MIHKEKTELKANVNGFHHEQILGKPAVTYNVNRMIPILRSIPKDRADITYLE